MADCKSILLVGVGGQGTILMSKALTQGLLQAGYDVKMSEVHGMAQRGGSVSTQVRYGDKVYSPIIGRGGADVLVAFERMESVRYASFLKPAGTALINNIAILPLPVAAGAATYPEGLIESMQRAANVAVIPATTIANALGDARCMNMVLLGALVRTLSLTAVDWEAVLDKTVPRKALEMNKRAFAAGLAC